MGSKFSELFGLIWKYCIRKSEFLKGPIPESVLFKTVLGKFKKIIHHFWKIFRNGNCVLMKKKISQVDLTNQPVSKVRPEINNNTGTVLHVVIELIGRTYIHNNPVCVCVCVCLSKSRVP